MPTYDYVCEACAHEFDEFQSITAKPLKTCPQCGAKKLKRLIGAGAGVIFKGSGFYQTDYRSDSYKIAADAENKPADKKADGKSDGKTESADKSATEKSESKPAADAKASKPPQKKPKTKAAE